jgi:hypothetical protein
MILASVPWLLRSHVAREDDERRKGLNISALHRHVNDHDDETTHEIVRVRNIGHQYFARTNMARTTARWNVMTHGNSNRMPM